LPFEGRQFLRLRMRERENVEEDFVQNANIKKFITKHICVFALWLDCRFI